MSYCKDINIANFNYFKQVDIVLICILLISSIFPLIGFGAYFRGEDAKVLIWLNQNPNLLDAFNLNVRYHPSAFRPVYEIILRIIYNTYGSNPLAFQIVSGSFFLGTILFLYKIARLLFSKKIAVLTIITLFSTFFNFFHYLYTPVQGLQYPVEMFFMLTALFFMLRCFKYGKFNYNFLISAIFTIIALFTHPVSAFLLPSLNIVLTIINWEKVEKENRIKKILAIAFFLILFLTIPIISPQGSMLADKANLHSPANYLSFILNKYLLYSNIFFVNTFNKLFITFPLLFGIANFLISKQSFSSNKKGPVFIFSVILAIIGSCIFYIVRTDIGFALFTVILAATAFMDKTRFFLAVWFFCGVLPLLVVPHPTGVYIRHSAFALSFIIGITWGELISEIFDPIQDRFNKISKLFSLNRIAVLLTAFIISIVVIAKFNIMHIPIVDNKTKQLDYFKSMGNNFRDTLVFLSDNLEKNASIYFLSDNSYDVNRIYTRSHLEKLRPAGFNLYHLYFELYDRADLRIKTLNKLFSSSDPNTADEKIIVATNNLEVEYLESHLPVRPWKTFKRGGAISKIYKYVR